MGLMAIVDGGHSIHLVTQSTIQVKFRLSSSLPMDRTTRLRMSGSLPGLGTGADDANPSALDTVLGNPDA